MSIQVEHLKRLNEGPEGYIPVLFSLYEAVVTLRNQEGTLLGLHPSRLCFPIGMGEDAIQEVFMKRAQPSLERTAWRFS